MTNPNDAIGTNAAYGSRTSVNAFNDIAQLASGRGVLSGWTCSPKSGMTVQLGGVAGTRDVAVAEDNLGNRVSINNRSSSPVDVAIAAASASAARYDAIVAYVISPAQAEDTTPDAPSVCGIIDVQGGTTGVSEQQIRSAITADGGTGSIAYYAVLATIYIPANTTTLTSANISQNYITISDSVVKALNDAAIAKTWTTVPYTSGYKASANTGAPQSIQCCVWNGTFFLKFGVSANSGDMNTNENVIGQIPLVVDGVDLSKMFSIDNHRVMRGFASGVGTNIGFFGLAYTTGDTYVRLTLRCFQASGWMEGQIAMRIEE